MDALQIRSGLSRWWRDVGSRRHRRALLGILIVALALRVAWCVIAEGTPTIGDPASYSIQGIQIAQGKGYNSVPVLLQRIAMKIASGSPTLPGHDVPTAWAPPGYPATLGALFWFVYHSPIPDNEIAAAVALNVALGVATIVLAFEIMRRLFDVRVALVTAALLALYPNLIFHTATLHWETTFLFVATSALLVVLAQPWPEGRVPTQRLIAFSVLLGIAVLIRPIALPMALVVIVVSRLGGASMRVALAQCGLVVAVVALMVLPWTIRNVVKLHSPVIVSTDLGVDLCRSRHPRPQVGYQRRDDLSSLRRYCLPSAADAPADEQGVKAGNYAMAKAIRFVAAHPGEEVELWGRRARYSYREDHDALDDAFPYVAHGTLRTLATIGDWYFLTILVLAAVGAQRFVRRGQPRRLFVALTGLALASTPMILYGLPRHKVPATVLFTMAAAVGLVSLVDRVNRHRSRTANVRSLSRLAGESTS